MNYSEIDVNKIAIEAMKAFFLFYSLFENKSTRVLEKLKCIIHYFNRVTDKSKFCSFFCLEFSINE